MGNVLSRGNSDNQYAGARDALGRVLGVTELKAAGRPLRPVGSTAVKDEDVAFVIVRRRDDVPFECRLSIVQKSIDCNKSGCICRNV